MYELEECISIALMLQRADEQFNLIYIYNELSIHFLNGLCFTNKFVINSTTQLHNVAEIFWYSF